MIRAVLVRLYYLICFVCKDAPRASAQNDGGINPFGGHMRCVPTLFGICILSAGIFSVSGYISTKFRVMDTFAFFKLKE